MRMRDIAGKAAFITGGASGIGLAIARALAEAGAHVTLADIDQAQLDKVTPTIEGALGVQLDVRDRDGWKSAKAKAEARFGPVDILVNNAGISLPASIDADGYDDAWAATLAVDLTAYTRTIRAVLADLRRNGDGRIVNVASTEGLGATAHLSPYTAAKHGVVGLTRSLAVELGPAGVTVNCVCPGPIHTGMTAPIPDEAKERFARRRVPMRRYGEPEEVAQVTLSLVLPAASYITGAVIPVDGGLVVQNT
jgi:3-oxoacyl-[acyl-carrier protein] reductase